MLPTIRQYTDIKLGYMNGNILVFALDKDSLNAI